MGIGDGGQNGRLILGSECTRALIKSSAVVNWIVN